jgi:hypothetical protein
MRLTPALKKRPGVGLLDVALAAVLLIVGTLFTSQFFTTIFDELAPRGETNGLRRYLLAEEMLRAQAEGLRAMRTIPVTDAACKLVTEPPGQNYRLDVSRMAGPAASTQQLQFFKLEIQQNNQRIGTLSMSTVRALGAWEGEDGKIGL